MLGHGDNLGAFIVDEHDDVLPVMRVAPSRADDAWRADILLEVVGIQVCAPTIVASRADVDVIIV